MPRPSRFLLLPFLLSLTGILFCCWNLWGSPEALCVTEGCRLFQDFTIGGISLWLIGALSFAVFLLAALTGFAAAGHVIAACGLMLDCVLLCVMIAAAPCFNCLLVGLLLALVFLAFRTARREQREGGRINEFRRPGRSASPLFALWGVLFLLDAGVVAHGMMKPWPRGECGRFGACLFLALVRGLPRPGCGSGGRRRERGMVSRGRKGA